MQNAKIFLVEDDNKYIEKVVEYLEHDGHEIPLKAKSLREAMEHIEQGRLEENHIRVVILDAYIPQNDPGEPFELWGPEIYKLIKHRYPSIKVIAYTSVPFEYTKYGDEYVSKHGTDMNAKSGIGGLRQAIKRL